MVFQTYTRYPHTTVHDDMAFGLKMQTLPKAEIDQRDAGRRRCVASRITSPESPGRSPAAGASASQPGARIVRHLGGHPKPAGRGHLKTGQ